MNCSIKPGGAITTTLWPGFLSKKHCDATTPVSVLPHPVPWITTNPSVSFFIAILFGLIGDYFYYQ